MNELFDICVNIMVVASKALNISYQTLNIILFVIVQPTIICILLILVIILLIKINKYKWIINNWK